MRKELKILTIIIIIFFSFSGCKRYEEDPITFRTPEQRIKRSWHLQSFTLDGKDSMDFMVRNKIAEKWSFGSCVTSSNCPFGILNGTATIATYSGN